MEEFLDDSTHLWGEHTLEICCVDSPVRHKGPGLSKLSTNWISSYAIVLVSERSLVMALITDRRDAVVDMVRVFRRADKKFRVPFTHISDIQLIKPEEDEAVEGLSILHYKDARPRSVLVYMKDDEGTCRIDTTGHTRIGRQLMQSWYSSNVRRSTVMKPLNMNSSPLLAADYLKEAIYDLQLVADKSRVTNLALTDKQEIFEEIADEAWSDMQIKDAAMHSRELFAATCSFCTEVC